MTCLYLHAARHYGGIYHQQCTEPNYFTLYIGLFITSYGIVNILVSFYIITCWKAPSLLTRFILLCTSSNVPKSKLLNSITQLTYVTSLYIIHCMYVLPENNPSIWNSPFQIHPHPHTILTILHGSQHFPHLPVLETSAPHPSDSGALLDDNSPRWP